MHGHSNDPTPSERRTVLDVRRFARTTSKATAQPPLVQKSPSLTVIESWLSTVVFAGLPTVPRTICFQVRRKLCSGPELVRRIVLSQARLRWR